MKWPFFERMLPEAKPWLKMDLDALGDKLGVDMGALMQLGGQNPSGSVGLLWGAKDVTTVGHQTINGVRTTHYEATIDFRLAASEAPADVREEISSSIDRLIELIGMSEAPVEVWIDGSNLVRREKITMDFSNADPSLQAPAMKMDQTTDYLKYGVKVDIKLPPASKVTDLMELIESSGGSTSF
jgi:hypothetical protein